MKVYEAHVSEELGYDSSTYCNSNAQNELMELIIHKYDKSVYC
jgi:hypothetical protein